MPLATILMDEVSDGDVGRNFTPRSASLLPVLQSISAIFGSRGRLFCCAARRGRLIFGRSPRPRG
jgi:hypothetical protein